MANQLKLWVNRRTLGAVGVVLLLAVALLVVKGLSGGSSTSVAGAGTTASTTVTSVTVTRGGSTTSTTARASTTQGATSASTNTTASTKPTGTTVAAPATVTAPPGVGTIARSSLPRQAITTLGLIDQGGPYPYRQDGVIWENREGLLPDQPRGYYHEYTVVTPGSPDRGARRIITGGSPAERYYTDDHYGSFRLIVPG